MGEAMIFDTDHPTITDTTIERRVLFQSLIWAYERKYGVTTKQAVKALTQELKIAYID